MADSTVRCQKCGHTGVPSPTVVLDLEAEIRELKAELAAGLADSGRLDELEAFFDSARFVHPVEPGEPEIEISWFTGDGSTLVGLDQPTRGATWREAIDKRMQPNTSAPSPGGAR